MDSLQIAQTLNAQSDTWEIIIYIIAILNLFVAAGMLFATKKYTTVTEKIFLSAQRPYIGRCEYVIFFNEISHSVHFTFKMKNFGIVPARNVESTAKLFFNDKLEPIPNLESKNQIFFPQQIHPMNIILDGDKYYLGIQDGSQSLKIVTDVKYYGVTDQEYSTTETEIYDHENRVFIKQIGQWT